MAEGWRPLARHRPKLTERQHCMTDGRQSAPQRDAHTLIHIYRPPRQYYLLEVCVYAKINEIPSPHAAYITIRTLNSKLHIISIRQE